MIETEMFDGAREWILIMGLRFSLPTYAILSS